MQIHSLYRLTFVDPNDGQRAVYIGRSVNVYRRIKEHQRLKGSCNKHLYHWLQKDTDFKMEILDSGRIDKIKRVEKRTILDHYDQTDAMNFTLINSFAGGINLKNMPKGYERADTRPAFSRKKRRQNEVKPGIYQCSCCRRLLNHHCFGLDRSRYNGLYSVCRECDKIRNSLRHNYTKNPQQIQEKLDSCVNETARAYFEKRLSKEYSNQYVQKIQRRLRENKYRKFGNGDLEKGKSIYHKYQYQQKKKRMAEDPEYYEKMKQKKREYYHKNKHKFTYSPEYQKKRYAKLKSDPIKHQERKAKMRAYYHANKNKQK